MPERCYHQVGPDDVASDMFVLSVTLTFAAKLEQVRRIARLRPATSLASLF